MPLVHLEAYACDDHWVGPAFATLDATPQFIERLLRLRQCVIDNGLTEARVFDEPQWDGDGEEMSLRNDELCVVRDAFWFRADVKHCDFPVETRWQGIDEFIAGIHAGQTRFGRYTEQEWDDYLADDPPASTASQTEETA